MAIKKASFKEAEINIQEYILKYLRKRRENFS